MPATWLVTAGVFSPVAVLLPGSEGALVRNPSGLVVVGALIDPWLPPGAVGWLGLSSGLQPPTTGAGSLLEAAGDPLLSLAALPREEELRLVGRFFTGSLDAAAAAEGRAGPNPWLTDGFGLEVTTVGPGNPEGLSVTRGLGIPAG